MKLAVGFGRYNITPPLGTQMAGYARRTEGAAEIYDELSARAVAFESGAQSAALIAADVCSLPDSVCQAARVRLGERTGIPKDNVIVAGVHTHAGPRLGQESPYVALLPDLLASAGELAWKRRRPAKLACGTGVAKGLCINRRKLGGPVDEQFAYLAAADAQDNLYGLLFSYPLHGVVMGQNNLTISADYIGAARRTVEKRIPGAETAFVAAPSGDINPLTPTVKALLKRGGKSPSEPGSFGWIYDRNSGTFPEVEQVGRSLGSAVVRALGKRTPVKPGKLRARAWPLNVGGESEIVVTLRAIEVGDLAIVALPGEHFVETGFALRQMAEDARRPIIALSHAGQLTYVPTRQAFSEGGYEVENARRRGLAEDAQERILESIRAVVFPRRRKAARHSGRAQGKRA
jgi:neutral ceramidase